MRKIAAWGWVALAVWFAVFETLGWAIQDWTLTAQWHEWMLALPTWLAWVLFGVYIFIGAHLWWPIIRGQKPQVRRKRWKD